jgi:hypothetical protein
MTSSSALTELSTTLWRERELLELLLFKLEEEQLLLAAGKARWLGHATREVEVVLEEIRRAELSRAVEVDAVALELGLSSGCSLRQLADAAPAPWGDVLREHRAAFLAVSQEVSALAEANRDLLTAGVRAARTALDSLSEPDAATYTPDGQPARSTRPLLLDRVG